MWHHGHGGGNNYDEREEGGNEDSNDGSDNLDVKNQFSGSMVKSDGCDSDINKTIILVANFDVDKKMHL